MYEKWVCTGRELPVFVRWEVVFFVRWATFLSVGRLLCSFCAAFLEARDGDKRCSFFPCDLASYLLRTNNTGDYPNELTSTVRAKTVTRITFLNR